MVDPMTLGVWLAALLGVGVAMLIPAAILTARFWHLLESRHRKVWDDLGRPRLQPMDITGSRSLRAYIRSGAYKPLDDAQLDSCARGLTILNVLIKIVFWAGAMLVIAVVWTSSIA